MNGTTLISFISNNALTSAIIAGLILMSIGWFVKSIKTKKDSNRIHDFLKMSQEDGSYTFRSSERISSATGIPEDRVESLCSKHNKIKTKSE